MHLLIDARSTTPTDRIHIIQAISWANYWKKKHPIDLLTWLVYDGESIPEAERIVSIPRKPGFFGYKPLASHTNGPDRIISFSKELPIDKKTKVIQHISDLAPLLYPHNTDQSSWEKRALKKKWKQLCNRAEYIVVPHESVALEISELLQTSEDKIRVLPYPIEESERIPLPKYLEDTHHIRSPYILTEGTPGIEWNPVGLIRAYAEYRKAHEDGVDLVIHGHLGEQLGYIMNLIREVDCVGKIRIIGNLIETELLKLYAGAGLWIWIGSYYSVGYRRAIAEGYGIPMILSDIASLRHLHGKHMHANHIHILSSLISESMNEPHVPVSPATELDVIMQSYARIITD